MWVFDAIPLGPLKGVVHLFYHDRMMEYKADNLDVLDMLTPLSARFAKLPPEEKPQHKLLQEVFHKGPFKQHVSGSFNGWVEKDGLDVLAPYVVEVRSSGGTVMHKGCEVELSAIGMTLYLAGYSTLKQVMTKFSKHLPNRNKPRNPDRMPSGQRRAELKAVFEAMNTQELKKGSRAIELPAGSKKDMVEALIKHFAPERKRKGAPAVVPIAVQAEALGDSGDGEGEDGNGEGGL